jgi:tetratricopeptide (TPR) repeat protein
MRFFAIALAICVIGAPAIVDAQRKKPAPAKKPAPKKPPPPPREPPPSPEKLRADKLFEDGRRYLTSKEYALACIAFEQSHEVDPAIGTQLNIALCYEEWGKIAGAYRAYLEAERLAKVKGDERAKGARLKIDELKPKVPRLAVTVPAHADVATAYLFDGKEIDRATLVEDDHLVEVGEHVIEARLAGQLPKQTTIELAQGERRAITLEVPRVEVTATVSPVVTTAAPRKKGRLYGGIGLAAGGTITMGVAGFVALVARQDYTEAVADCPERVCESRAAFDATQDARKKATLMTFVGAGGAVLAGVGVYLILTSKSTRIEDQRRVEITPVIGPDGLGFAVGGRL